MQGGDVPQRREPIKQRPKVEDESTGNGTEVHGKHREDDEALPGKGSALGGLNRASGAGRESRGRGDRDERGPSGGTRQNRGNNPPGSVRDRTQ